MVDVSATSASKTVQYVYDDLNRLISAAASNVAADQSSYSQNYTFDEIGNILTKTEIIGANSAATSAYSYSGSTGNSYANPHAVTSIGDGVNTINYTYDNNGNITAEGDKLYTFDYNNRLVQSSVPDSSPLPPTPSITITAPNGGETLKDGSTADIKWDSNEVGNVYIYWRTYSAAGTQANSGLIASLVPASSGSYQWAIPANFSVGKPNAVRMKIMVSSTLNGTGTGAITDLSDNYFSIIPPSTLPSIIVVSPNGGESFADGSAMNIKWASSNISNVYIYWRAYSAAGVQANSGLVAGPISATVGAYAWAIPANFSVGKPNAVRLKIMISSTLNGTGAGTVMDLSDNYFGIVPVATATKTSAQAVQASLIAPPAIITYAYDATGQRIMVSNSSTGVSTYYPTKFYNTDGTATGATKHIFANDADIATINGTGATAKIYYNSTDQLNSSSVMTDSGGVIAETMDYFPFGAIRIDAHPSTSSGPSAFTEQRKYIGQ
ncbi:MAG: Ser-Thr-rich GPI-anchored membrane family protein, partial [Patescibacteria group bacterium]